MASENADVVLALVVDNGGKDDKLDSELSKKLEIAEDLTDENDEDSESKLISLISKLMPLYNSMNLDVLVLDMDSNWEWDSKVISLIIQIISFVRTMDLDSQPKPESKFMSLITQTNSLFKSLDLNSLPKPISKLIALISQKISTDLDQKLESGLSFTSLLDQTLELKPDPELISLIRQIISLVIFIDLKLKKFVTLCPQVQVFLRGGVIHARDDWWRRSKDKWNCFLGKWKQLKLTGDDATYFRCRHCNGENHKEYEKFPLEIKHSLHTKHSLYLACRLGDKTRECYCCDEDLLKVFYFCQVCCCALNIACVEKIPLSARTHPKWHEHTLALFPSHASIPCDVCAIIHTTSPFYICPPCNFVVHQRCLSLPSVIRISRHPHRISFAPSFNQGDWYCGVCRKSIHNDYGGYSCIKDGCSYAVHSRCATQENVWDGIDLDGVPEEIVEVVDPFVRISDGVIRHFSHEDHDLRIDENTHNYYDENNICQVCITPIYFGKFYSCMQCEFILHETCANLPRKLYHPTHPHLLNLTLVGGKKGNCPACDRSFADGFFYECIKEECDFQLHVQCATISEPLVHESHVHPLFLTSKPGEGKMCCVCQAMFGDQTFNCIECDDFALCFECATIPPKVRYKHDKHILTLSYGEETSSLTYWCEACETKINPKERFYFCDEYCCVTLHIKCLIGKDLYVKPGSVSFSFGHQVVNLPNNHHMSRPLCSQCDKRCPYRIVFQSSGSIFCSNVCLNAFFCRLL